MCIPCVDQMVKDMRRPSCSILHFAFLAATTALSGCGGAAPAPPVAAPAVATAAPALEVSAAPAEDVAPLSELAAQFDDLESQQGQTNKKITDLLARYQRRGGSLPPGFGPDLTDEQRSLLAERLKTERAGLRVLLQDIIDRDKELTTLKSQSQAMAGRLPEHVTTGEGDRHDRIAMDFLIKQGVPAAKAYELVSQINLQDALVPGFRVWTHYQNGQFGTWVTAGTAGISPQQHQQRLTEMLRSEVSQVRSTLERTKADLDDTRNIAKRTEEELERTSADLAAMAAAAERERAAAEREQAENAKRSAAESTIRYVIGSKNQLVARKTIDKNLRLRALESAGAQSLNLLETSDISVDGSAYGLKRIKKLTLVPEAFVSGVDYQVTIEGPFARLRILKRDKFALTKFIAVVLE